MTFANHHERQLMQRLRGAGWVKVSTLPDSPVLVQKLLQKGWIEEQIRGPKNELFLRLTEEGLKAPGTGTVASCRNAPVGDRLQCAFDKQVCLSCAPTNFHSGLALVFDCYGLVDREVSGHQRRQRPRSRLAKEGTRAKPSSASTPTSFRKIWPQL